MRAALGELIQELRSAGLAVSLAESIDALRAAAAAGIERERLREALAAALVKDEIDRPTFDEVFERFFSAAASESRRRKGARRATGMPGAGRGHDALPGRGPWPLRFALAEPRLPPGQGQLQRPVVCAAREDVGQVAEG